MSCLIIILVATGAIWATLFGVTAYLVVTTKDETEL